MTGVRHAGDPPLDVADLAAPALLERYVSVSGSICCSARASPAPPSALVTDDKEPNLDAADRRAARAGDERACGQVRAAWRRGAAGLPARRPGCRA